MEPKPNQAQTPATLDVPVDQEMGMDFSATEGESGKEKSGDEQQEDEGGAEDADAGDEDAGDAGGTGDAEADADGLLADAEAGEGKDKKKEEPAEGEGEAAAEGEEGEGEGEEELELEQPQQLSAEQRQQQAQKMEAFRGWESQFNKVEKSLEDGSYDPLDNAEAMKVLTAGFKYLREGLVELHGHVSETRQEREAKARGEGYWKSWAGKNTDIPLKQARRIFQDELDKASATYKHPEAAKAVATEKWKNRLSLMRAQARAKQQEELKNNKGKKAVIPAGGTGAGAGAGAGAGRVLPKGTRTTQPPAAPKDTTSKLRSGAYGNVAGAFA